MSMVHFHQCLNEECRAVWKHDPEGWTTEQRRRAHICPKCDYNHNTTHSSPPKGCENLPLTMPDQHPKEGWTKDETLAKVSEAVRSDDGEEEAE